MRVVTTAFVATIITLAAGAGPARSRGSEAPQTVEQPSRPACHAYEQSPDGSWRQLPCQEDGVKQPSAAKISTRDAGKATR